MIVELTQCMVLINKLLDTWKVLIDVNKESLSYPCDRHM